MTAAAAGGASAQVHQVMSTPVLLRAVSNKSSPYVRKVYSLLVAGREARKREEGSVKEMVVPFCGVGLRTDLVAEWFPEWNVRFSGGRLSSAPLYDTIRFLVFEHLVRMDKWLGDTVICYDTPLDTHVAKCRDYVHTVKTFSTVLHAAEHEEELRIVARFASGSSPGATLAAEMVRRGTGDGSYYSVAGDLPVRRAETLVFDHTRVATCVAQVAAEMLARGSVRAKGMVMYSNDFFRAERGKLPLDLGEFVVDKGADTITVVPGEDPLRAVVMSYSALRQFAVVSAFVYGGQKFFLERLAHFCGHLLYRVTKVDANVPGETHEVHRVWDEDASAMVRLTYRSYDATLGSPDCLAAWPEREVEAPAYVYNKLYGKACDIPEGQFVREELLRLLRDVNNRAVGVGCTFSSVLHLEDPAVASRLATAVYLRAYQSRADHGSTTAEMLRTLGLTHRVRFGSTAAAWAAAVSATWDMVGMGVSGAFQATAERLFGQYVDAMGSLVDVKEAVRYEEFRLDCSEQDLPQLTIAGWAAAYHPKLVDGGKAKALVAMRGNRKELLAGVFERARSSMSVPVVGKKENPGKVGVAGVGLGHRIVPAVPAVLYAREVATVETPRVAVVAEQHGDVLTKLAKVFPFVAQDRAPLVVSSTEEEWKSSRRPPAAVRSKDPVQDVQEFLEAVEPGVSEGYSEGDTARVHDSDYQLNISAPLTNINLAKDELHRPKWMRPSSLRGPVGAPRQQTLREVLFSAAARNFDAPMLAGVNDPVRVAALAKDAFLRAYCVDDAQELAAMYRTRPIVPTYDLENEWIKNASVGTLRDLMACDISCTEAVASVYEMMVKSAPKPKLDGSASFGYTPVQVITYHKKQLNAFFSPLFMEVSKRVNSLLRSDVVMNVRKDGPEIQRQVNRAYRRARKEGRIGLFSEGVRRALENDFSKFDKSQMQECLLLEKVLYEFVGLAPNLLEYWIDSNVSGEVRSVAAGLRYWLSLQRKSGTATTSIGNTLVNMATVALAYDLRPQDYVYAVFLGDDSLVRLVSEKHEGNAVALMSGMFNLSAKCGLQVYGYCCSAWYLEVEDEVVIMSDAHKRGAALSAPAARDEGLIEEKEISMADLCYNYDDQTALEWQARAIGERTGKPLGLCQRLVEGVATIALEGMRKHGLFETLRVFGR